jgi:hypothetical protein
VTIRFDRLLKLADLLESLPPERFDYSKWGSAVEQLTAPACQTTACALGWATAIPEWGLRLAPSCSTKYPCVATSDLSNEETAQKDAWIVSLGTAQKVFGLGRTDANWLFIPSEDDPDLAYEDEEWGEDDRPLETASAKTVAEHIRNFVKERQGL